MKTRDNSGKFQNSFRDFFSLIIPDFRIKEWLWSVRHNLKVQVTMLGGREIRIITPVHNRSEEFMLYFRGGNNIRYSAGKLRKLISGICEKTGATIIIPDLWSFPELTHQETIDFLGDLYSNFFMGLNDRKIIFIGVSAGKDLAEEFAQKLRNERVCLPYKIIQLPELPDGNTPKPDFFTQMPDAVFQG